MNAPSSVDTRPAELGRQWPSAVGVGAVGAAIGGAASWFGVWAMTGSPPSDIGAAVGFAGFGAVLALALVWAPVAMRRASQGTAMPVAGVTTGQAPQAAASAQAAAVPGALPSPPLRSVHALLDAVPHLMWRADRHGVIVHANQAWLREFRRLRPLRVEDLIEVLADDDAGAFIGAWDAAQQGGGAVRVRCRLNKPGAEPRWTDLEIRPVRADASGLEGWVGMFTDVHDVLIKVESAQQSLAEERRLRERAERLAAMKDEFLATVSHELRSPLNAISGWAEILSRERGLADSALRAIGIVQRNARAQAKLIGDLQQLSSMVTGKVAMSPSQLDLGALAVEVAERYGTSALAKSIVLVRDRIETTPVYADAAHVGMAIGNLLTNAIQFSPEGSRVELAVEAVHDNARLTLRDHGRGIAADRLPALFDSLRPMDADPASGRPMRREGLGLGLAVARGMVELNHGSLQAASEGPGCGSCFTLTLPLSAPLPSSHLSEASDPDAHDATSALGDGDRVAIEAVAGLDVIIIDADADARELLRVALASLGAKPSVAADVDGGVDLLLARAPNVVLCDSGLPTNELSLLSFAIDTVRREHVTAVTAGSTAAVLAVVATDDTEPAGPADRIGELLHCGARLRKPVSLRKLAAAIAQATIAAKQSPFA